jgi:hypothetical protein
VKESALSFLLESIQSLAFVNPFANERDEIVEAILSQMGWAENLQDTNSKLTKELNQVLHWVREGEQFLLMEKDNKFRSVLRAEQMASFAYFSLFHELIDDLDALIESKESDSISNRKLFKKIESGIKRRRSLVKGS